MPQAQEKPKKVSIAQAKTQLLQVQPDPVIITAQLHYQTSIVLQQKSLAGYKQVKIKAPQQLNMSDRKDIFQDLFRGVCQKINKYRLGS